MSDPTTGISQEIADAPEAVARQEKISAQSLAQLVYELRRRSPQLIVTCGRGSSAHAATFGKHLIERYVGIPVCPAAPSIVSVYEKRLRLKGQVVLVISQSGTSNDLIAFAESARTSGAFTVAITNDERAPLAAMCDVTIPIAAGPEVSIPATKTYVATLSILMRLTAAWARHPALFEALERLPQRLTEATALDWSRGVDTFADVSGLGIIGRGPTLAIAHEASLKLKETCSLQAEAFSGAEFLHGPLALISARYPVLLFVPNDAAADGMRELIDRLKNKGVRLLVAGLGSDTEDRLPALESQQPEADAVCLIQSFYSMLVGLCKRRGVDADRPLHLRKITRTT